MRRGAGAQGEHADGVDQVQILRVLRDGGIIEGGKEAVEQQIIRRFIRRLKGHGLTRQQIKTLRGLALSGNIDGAEKGLRKIIERRTA